MRLVQISRANSPLEVINFIRDKENSPRVLALKILEDASHMGQAVIDRLLRNRRGVLETVDKLADKRAPRL